MTRRGVVRLAIPDLCRLVFRSVSPAGRISTSPIRSVKSPLLARKTQTPGMAPGPEVPPPWKQEGYVASSEAEMRETTVTSATQIRTEERWEGRYGIQEQVTVSGGAGAAASVSASAAFAAGAVAAGAAEVSPGRPAAVVFLSRPGWCLQPEPCRETPSVWLGGDMHMNIRTLTETEGQIWLMLWKIIFNWDKGSIL